MPSESDLVLEIPHAVAAAALCAALVACGPVRPTPVELDAEQLRLRAEGSALYDRVGWTYQHRGAAALMAQLVQRHADPGQVMELLPIEPGMVVADIGCGVGWFSFQLDKLVGPEGRVLAIDIQPEAVAVVNARATSPRVCPYKNVHASVALVDDCLLAEDSVDVVFLAHLGFYLHRELLDENVRWLESVAHALGPDGQLVVLEYIPPGFTAKYLVPHFGDAGFVLSSSRHFDRYQTWLYVFDVPAESQAEADD